MIRKTAIEAEILAQVIHSLALIMVSLRIRKTAIKAEILALVVHSLALIDMTVNCNRLAGPIGRGLWFYSTSILLCW